MSLFARVQTVVAGTLKLPVTRITETTRDEDLPAWDSLGQVNLMMALEQSFGVYIEVEDFEKLTSLPAILKYLGEHGVD